MARLTDDDRALVRADIYSQFSGGALASGDRIQYSRATFKEGDRRWKAGAIVRVFDEQTGEIKSETLKLGTWNINVRDPATLARLDPPSAWSCTGQELQLLKEYLNSEIPEGSHTLVPSGLAPDESLLRISGQSQLDADTVERVFEALAEVPDLAVNLAENDVVRTLAEAVEVQRRRNQLTEVARLLANDASTETDLHPVLTGQSWIFGGRYIGEEKRRRLTIQSDLDIPLIRGDGSLHIVELKGPLIPTLVEPYRKAGGFGVGTDVNRAVGQVQNYLRLLDEQRHVISDMGIECRRSSATVVVGHSAKVSKVAQDEVRSTLRNYNSYLSRVEVVTYDELLENALRSLNFVPG